jgi:hypothetical protein
MELFCILVRNECIVFVERPEGRGHLGKLGNVGRIILKWN